MSVKQRSWDDDGRPIDDRCPCLACTRYSRAYLRHLHRTRELLGHRLLTLHNLTYVYGLMRGIRDHIAAGDFPEWRRAVVAERGRGFDVSPH